VRPGVGPMRLTPVDASSLGAQARSHVTSFVMRTAASKIVPEGGRRPGCCRRRCGPGSARRRLIEAAEHVHPRRLPGAGRAHDGDHLAPLHGQVHVHERTHLHLTSSVGLADVCERDERIGHQLSVLRPRAPCAFGS
jgi:hypothetical protein